MNIDPRRVLAQVTEIYGEDANVAASTGVAGVIGAIVLAVVGVATVATIALGLVIGVALFVGALAKSTSGPATS